MLNVLHFYFNRDVLGIARVLFFALVAVSLFACDKRSADMYWYEEAKQDDGSIIVVKKIEISSGTSPKEPGAQNYGYRLPKVELTDPKTGKPIVWYPAKLPPLLPYALHIHDGVPYMFATFYLSGSYRAWGCPIPPYIVFQWESNKWKRIPMNALPKQFKKHNLLTSAANQIDDGNQSRFIKSEDLVKSESIEMDVRSVAGNGNESPYHRYWLEIQHDDIGEYIKCNNHKNYSTQYDKVELR